MSNSQYDTEVYSRGTTINDMFDNYLLFIHNIQVQQSNLMTLNSTIHNSLYSLINTTINNNEQRIQYNQTRAERAEERMNRRQTFLNRGRSSHPIQLNRLSTNSLPQYRNTRRNISINPPLRPDYLSFLSSSPVRVFPSTEQINNSTNISLYRDLTEQHNSICPIRNEEFNDNDIVIQINYCGHTFFPNEFYGWFRDHVHCPMCRHDIREQDASHNVVDTSINSINNTSNNDNNENDENNDNDDNEDNETSVNESNNELTIPIDISSSFFIYDLSLSNASNSNISQINNNQLNSLTQLTQTMARELVSQLNNEINRDLSSSEIELALSFVNTNNNTSLHNENTDDNIDSID